MAENDVIAVFKADISDMQKKLNELKKNVKGFGDTVEGVGKKNDHVLNKTRRGFDGLGHSINQLSREMPAFAYSAQIGFMALSNNIPMLADEINKLKAQNIELTKSGQASIPIWKSVTSALFSWQTLLSVGVTLLTIYGKEIGDLISKLFKFNKELNASTEYAKALNDVNVKGRQNAVEEKVKIDLLFKSIKDTNLTRNEQLSAVQDLMNLYPQYFKGMTEEQVLVSDLSKQYDLLSASILKKAKAQVAYEKIVENEKKILELEADLILAQQKANSPQYKNPTRSVLSGSGLSVIGKEANPLYEQAQANLKKIRKEIEVIQEVNRKLSDTAGGLFTDPNKNKGGGAGSERIKELKGAYAELVAQINDIETIIKDTLVEKGIANDTDIERLKELQKELLTINTVYDIMLNGIKEVNDEQENFEVPKTTPTKIAGIDVKPDLDPNTKKTTKEKIYESEGAFNASVSNFQQITQNITDEQLNSIDALEKAQLESLERQLEAKVISEMEYQKAKEKIEKESENKANALRRKQAETDKKLALFQASINGALAITKVLGSGNPLLIGLTVAAVATQIAAIQTQPIPKFEKGGHIKGNRHKQGGVLIEAEGGEFINNRISTQKYKEELESANNLSLERLIHRKHVLPAIRKERERVASALSSTFNDGNLLMSDRETRSILREIRDGVKNSNGYTKSVRFKNV